MENCVPEFGELKDYKFFCFNGIMKALFIASDRSSGNVKFDYFDDKFNHLNLVQAHPMSKQKIEEPELFEEMKSTASKLSLGLSQVRVDLYLCNHKIYFGELTFCHHGGITPFYPKLWDYKWGEWINLKTK